MEQFALCDVVMTQIKVSGGTTHSFATADEISCEPVIEEGETKNLTIKNKLIASKQVPDMVLGHDIPCKDNVFSGYTTYLATPPILSVVILERGIFSSTSANASNSLYKSIIVNPLASLSSYKRHRYILLFLLCFS